MKFIRQVYRGAGYLEGYGHHPGWSTFLMFIFIAGLAGIDKGGIRGFFGGMFVALIFMLPLFISGCISRANGCDEQQKQLLNKIKNSHD